MVVTVTRLSPAGVAENGGHDVYDIGTDVDEWGLRVDEGDFRLDDLNSITGLMRRAHEAGTRGEPFSVVETTTDGWPELEGTYNWGEDTITITSGPNTGDVLAWDETLQSYITISKGN